MFLLKETIIIFGCFLLTARVVSQDSPFDSLLDLSELDFIHDELMKFYSGIETTITILKPIRENIVAPIFNKAKSVAGSVYSTALSWLGFSSGGQTPTKSPLKLKLIKETITYKRRKEPTNTFVEAVSTIERGFADAKASRRWRRSATLPDETALDSILELAVEKRMLHYARYKLGHTLYDINHSSFGRTKRSTKPKSSSFLKELVKRLGPDSYKKLFAVDGGVTLAFVIDTTGSMADEIETAKRIAIDVINIPRKNPVTYILSPFNDPGTGPVTFNNETEGSLFVKTIGELTVDDGGDCPEMTMTGIMDAIDEGPNEGSPLYVFTDASAKDAAGDTIEAIKTMAYQSALSINFFRAGSYCGNPNYKPFQELADATSGQVLPLENVEELMKFNATIGNGVSGSASVISSGSNLLELRKRRDVSDGVFSFKVDESLKTISISITTTERNRGSTIVLSNPQGVKITTGKKIMSRVSIYEIKNPLVGTWTLTIPSGCGTHNYYVKSISDTNIDFEYYFMQSLPGPVSNVSVAQPLIGRQNKLIITLAGYQKVQKDTIQLELITKYGKHIRHVSLTPDKRGMRYLATLIPPSQAFKLKIKGTTVEGNSFERISRNVIEPKHVMLRVFYSNKDFILERGQRTFVTFHIFNACADETMKLSARDRLGYAAPIRRSTRTVRKGRWAFFRVVLNVPSDAKVNVSDVAMVSLRYNNGAGLVISPVQLLVTA